MSLERVPRDGWLQAFVLIAAVSGGLWAIGNRGSPAPAAPTVAPTAAPAVAPTAAPTAAPTVAAPFPLTAPAGRKRPRNGREWIVDSDGGMDSDAQTLSAAVAVAAAGDTIRLRRGLYRDSTIVEIALTIIGDGKTGETALIGTGDFALSARGAALTVESLTLSAPKRADARAIEARNRGSLRLVKCSVNGYEAESAAVIERGATLVSEDTEFTGGRDSALFIRGSANMTGGSLTGEKTLISVFGDVGKLDAKGVVLNRGEIGLATGDHARAILTGCRFTGLKLEAAAFSNSNLTLIDPAYDRASPVCLSRGGKAECRAPIKKQDLRREKGP